MRAHRFLHIIVGFNAQTAANCAYNKTREVGAMKISGSTIKIIAGVFITIGVIIILCVVPPEVYLFVMGLALVSIGIALLIKKSGC